MHARDDFESVPPIGTTKSITYDAQGKAQVAAMTAQRALEIGIVNRVVPKEQLSAAVDELIDQVLLGAPLSIQATKQSAMRGLDMTLEEAFYADYPAVTAMRNSDDAREGPKAFAEKRTPNWTGR